MNNPQIHPKAFLQGPIYKFITENYTMDHAFAIKLTQNILFYIANLSYKMQNKPDEERKEHLKWLLDYIFDDLPLTIIEQAVNQIENLDITDCSYCKTKSCPYRNTLQRLPESKGGLSLCLNFQDFPEAAK